MRLRTYARESDGALMVEVAPHQFVEQSVAIARGLVAQHEITRAVKA